MSGPAVHPAASKDTWRRPCLVCGFSRSWINDPDMCVVCYELTIDNNRAERMGRIVRHFTVGSMEAFHESDQPKPVISPDVFTANAFVSGFCDQCGDDLRPGQSLSMVAGDVFHTACAGGNR